MQKLYQRKPPSEKLPSERLLYNMRKKFPLGKKSFLFLKELLLDILFPQFCLRCGKEGNLICQDCLSTIEISEYQFCPFCKKPNRVRIEDTEKKGKCKAHQKMNLDGLFSATSYENSLVRNLIRKFKYQPFLKTLREPLAFLIIAHFFLSGNKNFFEKSGSSLFLPVPLYYKREKWRGFNQSSEIAKILSEFFKIPLQTNNLIKIKRTQPQANLSREERKKNVKDAFLIKNHQTIKGKRIFLVDDVFTTGQTLEGCSKVLKEAGAKEVWGIVIARE